VGAKHEVAALPGGQALADLADKVDGAQPEAIRRIAKHWPASTEHGTALPPTGLSPTWPGSVRRARPCRRR
jgi:hypothetical protein